MRRYLTMLLAFMMFFMALPLTDTYAKEPTSVDEVESSVSADIADAEVNTDETVKGDYPEDTEELSQDHGDFYASSDVSLGDTGTISEVAEDTTEDEVAKSSAGVRTVSDDMVGIPEATVTLSEDYVIQEDKQETATYTLDYTSNGDSTCTVTGIKSGTATGTLIIPSSLDGLTVTKIKRYAFSGESNFSGNLSLPDTIKEIGESAFYGCSGITGLKLPSAIETIGDCAFENCVGINGNILIPGSLTNMGYKAFAGCTRFNSLTLSPGIKSLNGGAFKDCKGIKGTLEIPDSITKISNNSFCGCSGITSVKIGNGVETIGFRAFDSCTGLKTVTFGSNITQIDECAFDCCRNITGTIKIPEKVKTIGSRAFFECNSITGLVLPEGLETIGDESFRRCYALSGTLRIPSTISSWGYRVFSGSGDGGTLVLSEGLTAVGAWAFESTGFTGTLTIPRTLKEMGYSAFADSKFSGIVFTEGITTIGSDAFSGCTEMKGTLTIPDSVTVIGSGAFSGCSGFTKLKISKNISSVEDSSFRGLYNVAQIINNSAISFSGADFINDDSRFYKQGSSVAIDKNGTIGKGTYKRKPVAPVMKKVSLTADGIKVTWDASKGVTKYQIQRKKDSGSWQDLSTVKSTSFTDKNVSNGHKYSYRLRAYGMMWSAWSKASAAVYYVKATTMKSASNAASGITVKWKKASGGSGYIIQRRTGGGSWSKAATISNNNTVSYIDKKATTNGKSYEYRVLVTKKSGGKTYKSGASSVIQIYRLKQPSAPALKNNAKKTLKITWNRNSSGTGYEIQYTTDKNFKKSIQKVTVANKNTVKKTLNKLNKNKTYYVRIRTYRTVSGKKQYSAWSKAAEAKITR